MYVELQNYHPRVPIIYGRFPLGIPVTLFVCFTPYHRHDTVQTVNLKTLSAEDRVRSQATNGIYYREKWDLGRFLSECSGFQLSVSVHQFFCVHSSLTDAT